MAKSGAEGSNTRLRQAGDSAWRFILMIVVGLVLIVTVAGLGFLVYAERLTTEPFLLLVGIIVGFSLGRSDAIL